MKILKIEAGGLGPIAIPVRDIPDNEADLDFIIRAAIHRRVPLARSTHLKRSRYGLKYTSRSRDGILLKSGYIKILMG